MYLDRAVKGGWVSEVVEGTPRFTDINGKTLMNYMASPETFPIPDIENVMKKFACLGSGFFGPTGSVKVQENLSFNVNGYITDGAFFHYGLGQSENHKAPSDFFYHLSTMAAFPPTWTHYFWMIGPTDIIQLISTGITLNKWTLSLKENEPVLYDIEMVGGQTTFTSIATLPTFNVRECPGDIFTLSHVTLTLLGEDGSALGTADLENEEVIISHDNKLDPFYGVDQGSGIYATRRFSKEYREDMIQMKGIINSIDFYNWAKDFDGTQEKLAVSLVLQNSTGKTLTIKLNRVTPDGVKIMQDGVTKIDGTFAAMEDYTKPHPLRDMITVENLDKIDEIGNSPDNWPVYGSAADDAPIAGTPLSLGSVAIPNVVINLGKAEDAVDAETALSYKMYRSDSQSMVDIATAEAATLVDTEATGLPGTPPYTMTDTTAVAGRTYYYAVVVEDTTANKTLYHQLGVAT